MKILLTGGTGMVGEGVLRYLLTVPDVTEIVALSRTAPRPQNPRLSVVLEPDLFHLTHMDRLSGFDACFYCLGISSVGVNEADYRRTTHDLALSIADTLLPRNRDMVFEFISGEGADPHSKQMWARVKAETERDILAAGFRDAYALRPGIIEPMRGAQPRVRWMRMFYTATAPFMPLLQRLPRFVTSTDNIAKAMLRLAQTGSPEKCLNNAAINRLATSH